MDIEIIVIGESSKWVLNHPCIRIGQDPKCEVSLPAGRYPAVTGEHVALHVVNGAVTLAKGEHSSGDTYLNGHFASDGAVVRSGDILRLGAAGPELRIRLLERHAYAVPVEHEPTRVLSQPAPAMPEPMRLTHEPTRIISSPAAAVYSSAPPLTSGTVIRQGYSPEAAHGVPAIPKAPLPQSAGGAADGESLRILEDKLKTIRRILLANLAILVLLLVWIFVQGRELDENRDELRQLHAQARNAVGQLTPALDARLSVFEKRMDGLDTKIAAAQDRMVKGIDAQTKRAEDSMVTRMNAEIPAMLDQYISKKLGGFKH
jgi:hypothetical protein